ncbi:1,2-phenylacetyl-CoA epoxidase subunit PaaC [Haloactinopolyspora alba]|uniref:1,2-phenylacetyl-CoA epoxidase subunit PaaC n=1 Tax=Haloactinopolyspora alba TaxID=648780 RepID=UPI000D0D191A|nr:1,2-phenylacetyl-CoA epoxidase subunit PaaC [Haloactinopolyspora alba]
MSGLVEYTLRLGDDALILSQRLGEWITRAPQLEEDVALANIALDLLGQARSLLTYAGEAEGAGRDEDALAYWRDERDFRNVLLVERPNGDFAETMARQLWFTSYQYELYDRLRASADPTLAAVAAKAVKEVAYHRDHAAQWVLRLGDGTDESRRRMQGGLAAVAPYVDELFDPDGVTGGLGAVAVDPAALREPSERHVDGVLDRAGLERPPEPAHVARGGRRGLHTEVMGYLLAEMQHLHRSHEGASW